MSVNTQKTKVVIFGQKQSKKESAFSFGDLKVEVVSEYTYLGVTINSNGNFAKGVAQLKTQACRAMFSVLKKARKLSLSVDVQLHLFDSIVLPVALYGSEVWGFKNVEIIEKLHLQFCKMILGVKKCTPSCMVLGDLGRLPIKYQVDVKMLCFWYKVAHSNEHKYTDTMYQLLYNLDKSNIYTSSWLKRIKTILQDCDLYELWISQNVTTYTSNSGYENFKRVCKEKLKLKYQEDWYNDCQMSNKCYLYKNFKTELVIEKYLTQLSGSQRYNLTKLRMCNHKLPIEVGRYNNVIRANRICKLCDNDEIGDEFHYIMICPRFKESRCKLFPKVIPNIENFYAIMKNDNAACLSKMAKIAGIIFKEFQSGT